MNKLILSFILAACSLSVQAGVINPDCDASKAAKSTAAKATVGVGGRCSPKEAVTDSVEIDDKVENTKDKVDDATDSVSKKAKKIR